MVLLKILYPRIEALRRTQYPALKEIAHMNLVDSLTAIFSNMSRVFVCTEFWVFNLIVDTWMQPVKEPRAPMTVTTVATT